MPTEPPTLDDDALDRALASVLRQGEEPAVPMTGPALRARAAASPLDRAAVGVGFVPRALAALAAVVALSWMVSVLLAPDAGPELTPRAGVRDGPPTGAATLVAVLDGALPQRLPRVGGEIPPGGSVVFQVVSGAPGFGCVEENAHESGTWRRIAGTRATPLRLEPDTPAIPRARGVPQAFSTDAGPGTHAYRLLVHPTDAGCARASVTDSVTLTWASAR